MYRSRYKGSYAFLAANQGSIIIVFCVLTGSCRTRSSNGNCCVFPFIYRGKRYNRCSRVNSRRPWCANTPNYDVDKLYGYCGRRKGKCNQNYLKSGY